MTYLNDIREARTLARQVVKDASSVRVKFGKTNGHYVLHVYEPGGKCYTVYNFGQWAECPLNPERIRRDRGIKGLPSSREREIDALNSLIANKDAI